MVQINNNAPCRDLNDGKGGVAGLIHVPEAKNIFVDHFESFRELVLRANLSELSRQ
jgi:hypothetical protein